MNPSLEVEVSVVLVEELWGVVRLGTLGTTQSHVGVLLLEKEGQSVNHDQGLQFNRVVDDHRPGRLLDLEILTDFKIMVDQLQNCGRQ